MSKNDFEVCGSSQAYNTQQAAEILNLRPQTLANWRHENRGPAYCMVGGKPVYFGRDINGWLSPRRVDPEKKR